MPMHFLPAMKASVPHSSIRCFSQTIRSTRLLRPIRSISSKRCNSTHTSFRKISGAGTHRPMTSFDPDNIPGSSSETWQAGLIRASKLKPKGSLLFTQSPGHNIQKNTSNSGVDERIETTSPEPVSPIRYVTDVSGATTYTPLDSTGASNEPMSSHSVAKSQTKNAALPKLSHLTSAGDAHMVSIADKPVTKRSATATATVHFANPETLPAILAHETRKGDAVGVSRIAGIQAAKKTADLIPLAHPGLQITGIVVTEELFRGFNHAELSEGAQEPDLEKHDQVQDKADDATLSLSSHRLGSNGGIRFTATVTCTDRTGVEMEALTSATVAALTMFDMLKSIDKGLTLGEARVISKTGGKSGNWTWDYLNNRLTQQGTDKGGKATAQPKGKSKYPSYISLAAQHRDINEKKITSKIAHIQTLVNESDLLSRHQNGDDSLRPGQERQATAEQQNGEAETEVDITTVQDNSPEAITSSIDSQRDETMSNYDVAEGTDPESVPTTTPHHETANQDDLPAPKLHNRIGRVGRDDLEAVRMERWNEWEKR